MQNKYSSDKKSLVCKTRYSNAKKVLLFLLSKTLNCCKFMNQMHFEPLTRTVMYHKEKNMKSLYCQEIACNFIGCYNCLIVHTVFSWSTVSYFSDKYYSNLKCNLQYYLYLQLYFILYYIVLSWYAWKYIRSQNVCSKYPLEVFLNEMCHSSTVQDRNERPSKFPSGKYRCQTP